MAKQPIQEILNIPVAEMTPAQKDEALEHLITQSQHHAKEVQTFAGNLRWLRQLLEESVGLTENASGILVEHTSTLDARLGEIGNLFVSQMKQELVNEKPCKAE